MTLVNTIATATYENSDDAFEVTVSDTNDHDLPDVDGDDSDGGEGYSAVAVSELAAKVTNHQDQSLSADLEATTADDPNFDNPVTVVSGTSVAAGGTTKVLRANTDSVFDYYRVVVNFGTAPTGNNPTAVAWASQE